MTSIQVPLPMARAPLPLPRELYIESTTRCNEFCDQCPRTHLGREADRDITPDEVRQIVAQIPDLERVVLHGLGEPLLNARLPEIIALLRERNIWVLFNSNALAPERETRASADYCGAERTAHLAGWRDARHVCAHPWRKSAGASPDYPQPYGV